MGFAHLRILSYIIIERQGRSYAMKNFGAVFNCKLDREEFTVSNRTDMDEVLKKASAEHLMDDNDDTILNIKCTFKKKYQNEN